MADDLKVTIRWIDDKDRVKAEDLLQRYNVSPLGKFSGHCVAYLPAAARSDLEASKLTFSIGELATTVNTVLTSVLNDPLAKWKEWSKLRDLVDQNLNDQKVLRAVCDRSRKVSGTLWNNLSQALDRVEEKSAARGEFAGPVADDDDVLDADMYLVDLRLPLKPAWRRDLEGLGLRVSPGPTPNVVRLQLTKVQLRVVQGLEFVRTVKRYGLEETLGPVMMNFLQTTALAEPDKRQAFDMVLHRVEDYPAVHGFLVELQQDGVAILFAKPGSTALRIEAAAGSDALAALMRLPQIRSVEPYEPPQSQMELAGVLVGCRTVGPATGSAAVPGWTGDGEIVAVFDTGIDTNHPDLRTATAKASGGGLANDTDGHGTHVCGIIGGRGAFVRGVAPGARIISYGLMTQQRVLDIPPDLEVLLRPAVADGAKIINISWKKSLSHEANKQFNYNHYSCSLDKFILAHPDILVVVAAGNDGTSESRENRPDYLYRSRTVGNPASAKNALAVGACRSSRTVYAKTAYDEDQSRFPADPVKSVAMTGAPYVPAAFSARGPADAERVKPDVVAPGTAILSAKPKTSTAQYLACLLPTDPFSNAPVPMNDYAYLSGTSMAAPMVAGCAAILREYLRKEQKLANPSSALLKALLALATIPETNATEHRLVAYAPIVPDYEQGHGRVDLTQLLPHPNAPADRKLLLKDVARTDADALISDVPANSVGNSVHGVPFTVAASAPGTLLRVALCWHDTATQAAHNVLGLSLRLPDDTKLYGNASHTDAFPDPFRPAGAEKFDRKNNLQTILLKDPPPGDYLVGVTALSTPSPPQGFSLAVCGLIIV